MNQFAYYSMFFSICNQNYHELWFL